MNIKTCYMGLLAMFRLHQGVKSQRNEVLCRVNV